MIQMQTLNVQNYIESIMNTTEYLLWTIIDPSGAIYQWNGLRKRLRRIISNEQRRRRWLSEANTIALWEELIDLIHRKQFTQITTLNSGRLWLHQCHRKILKINPNKNILCLGTLRLYNGVFYDEAIPKSSTFQIDPLQNIILDGRLFRLRIQAEQNKLYIRNDDIFNKFLKIESIKPERIDDSNIEDSNEDDLDDIDIE